MRKLISLEIETPATSGSYPWSEARAHIASGTEIIDGQITQKTDGVLIKNKNDEWTEIYIV